MDILFFCYQGFSNNKIYFILFGVFESSVKYDDVVSHAVPLGMISIRCFPLTVSSNG